MIVPCRRRYLEDRVLKLYHKFDLMSRGQIYAEDKIAHATFKNIYFRETLRSPSISSLEALLTDQSSFAARVE